MENGRSYAFGILMELQAGAAGLLIDVLAAALIAFASMGWWRSVRSGPEVAGIFLPLYLGMVLLWPAPWAADRLLLPVLPVILLYAAEGVTWLPGRAPAWVRAAALAGLLALSAPALKADWDWGARCRAGPAEFPERCLHPHLRSFIALAAWTEGRLSPGSVALSRKPTFLYFHGGVPGRPYPFTRRTEALFEAAADAGARYVVLDRLGAVSSSYLVPVLRAHPDRFCVVQAMRLEGREALLLGILPEASGGAAGPSGPTPSRPSSPGPPDRPAPGDQGVGDQDEPAVVDFPVCPASYLR